MTCGSSMLAMIFNKIRQARCIINAYWHRLD
jgi:hypothetical protein